MACPRTQTAPTKLVRARSAPFEPELEVMLRVARTLTGNQADAEDLVHETVIRAFNALDRLTVHTRARGC